MASIRKTAKTLADNFIEATHYQDLTEKVNVQAIARLQEIRKVVHREALRSDGMNAMIQAKLANLP
ncbi:MAG: hypothetical protein H6662_00460 [Ardenticatenaceae bacterium]|nr:hypothetical protein [Anaerolineales bacterium]MCB8920028.1 hypothetical protein [Ardenticatenaceae bacterium]MCB8989873.1 hypothetical protein [Ardenticatenaceae bacterium]MCB9005654.1 hypothetical protein [Ardenticatenaceae bacterium]